MQKLPTWVEINLDNLLFNISAIRDCLTRDAKILLTIKADAYGHGAVQIAAAASELVDYFGVATMDEATELKRSGISADRILILSPILDKEIPAAVKSGFSVAISSYAFARMLSEHAQKCGARAGVHIEIDTGMGRTGAAEEKAEDEIIRITSLPGLRIEGVFTHFPASDTNPEFTLHQIRSFLAIIRSLKNRRVFIPLIHSANSSAIDSFEDSLMDMVRPGLLAYGHLPDGRPSRIKAKPVMSWKSRLVLVRQIAKGRSISYERTFVTGRDTLMGVVPVGYGHGYPFRVSNKGRMLVRGRRVPVLGRITMDMTMVDLTDLDSKAVAGDEVVILGRQGKDFISLHELAGWAGTIPYEILCGISKRVPRAYLRKGKVEIYRSLLGVSPNLSINDRAGRTGGDKVIDV